MVGRTISHYEILEKLGEGGMGVVYRARDTRLGRIVAIKAVAPEKVGESGARRRFEQEARSASALNHPHIVHIYDIAESDGIQFIAMEYVDGKTLDELIDGKGLRLNETLKYAVQIADALAKAHSAGIVHRDLKPSNIMVSSDGLVKVLDFGLAKLTERVAGDFGATTTISTPNTAEGAIVGTIAYLSPEQAEGKPVDARSDLFALGAVLYEMVTGQRAFQGSSNLATLLAILKDDPKPVSAAVDSVPRDLERIITRCLRKDPGHRFQHTEDLKIALVELKQESDSGIALISRAGSRPRWRKLGWIAVGLTAIVALAVGLKLWRAAPSSPRVAKIVPITTYAGDEMSPSFSPDGSQLAFAWDAAEAQSTHRSDIYLKLMGESEPVRLTHDPANEFSPAWSPDGRYVAFLRTLSPERAGVFVIPAIGGREHQLAEVFQIAPEYGDYGGPFLAWLPDGKWLVVVDKPSPTENFALFLLSAEGGEKRKLTSPPPKYDDTSPAVSPDGRSVAFARFARKNIGDLFVMHLSESLTPKDELVRLTFEDRYSDSPAWTPDGRAIVFASGSFQTPSLWKVGLSRRPAKPEPLAFAGEGARQPAISRRGQLAYAQFSQDVDIWKLDLNGGQPPQKPATHLVSSTRIDHEAVYSPDGKRIVFTSNRSGSFEIWACNSDGSKATQLTSFGKSYYVAGPNWSPDGRFIYFNYNPNGQRGVHMIRADGGAPTRLPIESLEGLSRDGKWIYFHAGHSAEEPLWKVPRDGGAAIRVTRQGGFAPMESADGRYLYYVQSGAGNGLWRLPLAGGEEVRVVESVFNNNYAIVDRGVYFIPNSKPFSVNYLSFDARKVAIVARIPREPAWGFSVSPDGRSLLYSEFEAVRSDLMLVENFR